MIGNNTFSNEKSLSQLSNSKLQKEFHLHFPILEHETLIFSCKCAKSDRILLQGRMFISKNYLCFKAPFIYLIMKFDSICNLEKKKKGFFSNSISFFFGKKKYLFTSFTDRDRVFNLIENILNSKQSIFNFENRALHCSTDIPNVASSKSGNLDSAVDLQQSKNTKESELSTFKENNDSQDARQYDFPTLMSNLINLAKKLACQKAVDEYVTNATKVIGIGSGSTIGELNQFSKIDVAFDGADEVDQNLNLIKGGGGCHLQEKLIASNAEKFVVVADYRKNSVTLGENWKKGVPLEVIPFAYVSITEKLKSMGGKPTLRMAINKAGPVVTDNGNFIIDVDFDLIKNPSELNLKLIQISGVVETGLFCGMSEICYFGQEDGSVKVQRK
ncbi:hypothetical protein HK099_002841 [Clydaea vesicula]|uniref:Ribose-5-phosphate isomerase n=1 Tax=Clydaea vesicula TaxID=447962 RepID=A0AAD5Y0K0_9FUNG|nr:hypothetical protein HK099_002841 [Clydaea vesicula]